MKDKWKGYTYEQTQRISADIELLKSRLDLLRLDVVRNSINTDDRYNEIFEMVESLYGELDLHNLALDNNRRWKAHKDILKKKGKV